MTKILVVEDDPAIQEMLKACLEKANYQILSAFSGTEGKLLLQQTAVDLILLDLMLPGMTGEALLTNIRQLSSVPVIVISAKKDVQERVHLLQNGADDYLIKPFDLAELLARIQIQLRHQRYTQNTQKIVYQDIELDLETHEVSVANQPVNLTMKEFQLLTLFLTYPQKVFSRQNIYETIWEEPYYDSDKTINVHISNLRAKINLSNQSYIKTVWGIGFKFD
ncbi:hypothetical protein DOK78_000498 [Enterococcus sp. DIV2402]|uniref:DNA-binding response regulator n=1 Tax=Candidatus Enterococcus lowellii TaxID=2230877 RepID=A0ABZ2SK83_9ENTE|nr:response regulator transcription factor [Enterococcus sp. DIV2402]MBO0465244.1 response regulator transcription factor [Enterococcus sp. DIV2402]